MKHPISPEDWIDYGDRVLSDERRLQLEAHLLHCSECRETLQKLQEAEEFLAGMASPVSNAGVSADEMQQAKTEFLAALQEQDLISARLRYARFLLAPVCGTRLADQLLRVAARRASAQAPEMMSVRDWPCFLSHLTGIITSLCGKPTALALSETLAR